MTFLKAALEIKWSEARVYRENFLINFIVGLFPLVINIFLWKTVFTVRNGTIGGYDLQKMITYFLLVFFIDCLTSARSVAVELSETIRNGSISNFILKPIGFFRYYFTIFAANKVVYFVNICIPLILFIALMQNFLFFYSQRIILFVLSTIFAGILHFLIYLILGLLTVWIEEISSLLDVWKNISFLLAGGAFPLSMLPSSVFTVISYLPFKYMFFTPINLYLENLSVQQTSVQLALQILWILILMALFFLLWKKAMRDFSGYGI